MSMVVLSVVAMVMASPAAAQPSEPARSVAWRFDGEATEAVIEGVAQALSTERSRHLLTPEDVEARVRAQVRPWPSCALGVEPCGSATALAMDALGVELLVRVEVVRQARQLEVNYEIVDWRGAQVSSGSLAEREGRAAGFELVRELFDASGVISVESEPDGAQVWLDGEVVGQTPWSGQRAVGRYAYRLALEGYERVDGEVEVGSGEAVRLSESLEELPGRLRVLGAPDNAEIWIQDAPMGRAAELLELPAGRYAVEVRAEGYEPLTQVVDVAPARLTETTVTMTNPSSLLREIDVAALVANRLQVSAGVELGFHRSAPRQTRGDLEGLEYSFEGWREEGQLEARSRRTLGAGGLRLDAIWEGEQLGLTLLSLSYAGGGVNEEAELWTRPGGGSVVAQVERRELISLRPLQLRFRFIWQNLVPHVEAGLGVNWERLRAWPAGSEASVILSQARAFWSLGAGVRYHFDPRWSVGVSYRTEIYLGREQGAQHLFGVMVGVGIPQIPGLSPQPPEQL
ncbi:PEGA domain-containing protein [Lujinxingia vulgaris]|uniref:PEGA domain-containing protein n=2 Tax=Lujinxingia vulgaris TaxID=2600176 RepID=A0A5C6WTI7_9DELT|nr:PEGA domain-containing protein [Lujinxingia vulgaris]